MNEVKFFKERFGESEDEYENFYSLQVEDEKIVGINFYDQEYFEFQFEGDLIEALSSFTYLRNLEVELSQVTIIDISGLANFKYLEKLTLIDCCRFEDISVLADLKYLTHLTINNSGVKNIDALKDLTSLVYLDLSGNEIISIDVLKSHSKLTSVNLSNNKLVDISALANCKWINMLYLDNNTVVDLSFLATFTQMEHLRFEGNKITDLNFLNRLTLIRMLWFSNNPVNDIDSLVNLPDLQHLSMKDIVVNNLNPIQQATKLTYLNAGPVRDFNDKIISQFLELNFLSLQNCGISDLSFLKPLKKLYNLNLDDNKLDNISMLLTFSQLGNISLQNNLIKEPFLPLELNNLRTLDLRGNLFGNKLYDQNHNDWGGFVQLYEDTGRYWYLHGDYDKALAYFYVDAISKISLTIYYKKLLIADQVYDYFRLYYVMKCEYILRTLKEEDEDIIKIKNHIIDIIKQSSFFNRNELLISLEQEGKNVLNYHEYSEYTAYLNSGYDIQPHPEILYKLSKSFKKRENLNILLSLYKQLYMMEHPLHLAIYRKINRILKNSFAYTKEEREAYEYNRNLLFHINDFNIPFFDATAWFKDRYSNYVHDKHKKAGADYETQTVYPDNSGFRNVLLLLFITMTLLSLFKACNFH